MNYGAYRWAKKQPIKNAAQKAVLMALAEYTNEEGYSFPSQALISEGAGLSVRTVRSALKALEAASYIVREKRSRRDNRGRSSDLILVGWAFERENKKARPTGKSRTTYRQLSPGKYLGKYQIEPSQVDNSGGYRLEDTREAGCNVVAFPPRHVDDEESPFGRASA